VVSQSNSCLAHGEAIPLLKPETAADRSEMILTPARTLVPASGGSMELARATSIAQRLDPMRFPVVLDQGPAARGTSVGVDLQGQLG